MIDSFPEKKKFFVEAKKPGVSIRTDAGPAYQVRRYAWSAKLPLSLLTDFEDLAVYDCRTRPSISDQASVARINFFTFDQYPDRWREVWEVFSREAVRGGSFDQSCWAVHGCRISSIGVLRHKIHETELRDDEVRILELPAV